MDKIHFIQVLTNVIQMICFQSTLTNTAKRLFSVNKTIKTKKAPLAALNFRGKVKALV